jgi:hypothetical protein
MIGRAVASKFVVDGDVLLLKLLESLESLFVVGVDFDAAVAVDVQELVAQKLLEGGFENSFGSYSCVLDCFAACGWVGLAGYREFQLADEKFVVPLYCSHKPCVVGELAVGH